MPLYLQPVLGLMVSGCTVAGEYNYIHYAPAALPCNVMSELRLPRIATCTRILLASQRMYVRTSMCIYVHKHVCVLMSYIH